MSQENVENVRRAFEAWLGGDLEEALAGLDPDLVYKPAQEEAVQGLDAVQASWERWQASWREQEVTLEETIDAGDHVIVIVRLKDIIIRDGQASPMIFYRSACRELAAEI